MTTEKEIEEGKRALQFLDMQGYRRCSIAACNCPYWHGGNAGNRLQEIHEVLSEAGLEPHRKTAIKAIEDLIAEKREALKYLIWSNEHNSWWMPNSSGYTQRSEYAGRYTLEAAIKICNGANYGWDADTVRKIPMELPVSEESAILLEYRADGERYSLFKSVGSENQ